MRICIDGDILVHHAVAPSTIWKVGMNLFRTKKEAYAYKESVDSIGKSHEVRKRFIQPSPIAIADQLRNMIESYTEKALKSYIDKYEQVLARQSLTSQWGTHDFISIRGHKSVYLKGDGINYRYKHAKTIPYKQNRGRKPYYYKFARDYIADNYHVVYANGQESDDELGIAMLKGGLCVSMDKDMRTVPGLLYDPYKGVLYDISREEADRNFYTQLLVGDRADNCAGVYGIGPVKAGKILEGASDKKDMLYRVLATYEKHRAISPRRARDMVDEIGKLLYIRRAPEEIWSVEEVLYG